MKIVLPFPSSILAGHAKGNGQWAKVKATKDHREWARLATLEARGPKGTVEDGQAASGTDKSDIAITIRFIPPHNRGDRMNYPARMKPYVDGIADALGVNDKRFHPLFVFCAPEKPGFVEVFIGGKQGAFSQGQGPRAGSVESPVVQEVCPEPLRKQRPGRDHTLERSASV